MDELVTIKRFTYNYEVSVIQGRLESEGIQTFIKDENMATVHPFSSNALGGVKLQVRSSDAPRATEILKETGQLDDFEKPADQEALNTNPSTINLKVSILLAVFITVVLLTLFFVFG